MFKTIHVIIIMVIKMKITVLGAGAYGTALSTVLEENKNEVTIWSAFKDEIDYLQTNHESPRLKGIKLSESFKFTTDLKEAITNKDLIVIATPTGAVDEVTKQMQEYYDGTPICAISKGIEQDTCLFVYDVIKKYLNTDEIAVMSGPSFAIDVANKVPVGLTLAGQNKKAIDTVYKAFANDHFKLRKSYDIVGTEVCGAIKNVIAIASGILSGLGLPESTIAMLITDSLHDIKELIKGLGGNGSTVYSFAGFGDLLLTATSTKSRNFSFGKLIGEGASQKEIDEYIKNTTVEGLYTLKSVRKLVDNKAVEMPIIDLINDIIYNGKNPKTLIDFLIQKP